MRNRLHLALSTSQRAQFCTDIAFDEGSEFGADSVFAGVGTVQFRGRI